MTTTGAVRSIADRNVSAVDLFTAEIRRAVLTGTLPPGKQFSIRGLARELGVSHIPIREALRRLEGQGLVVLSQARSAAVAPLSTEDLAAIYRLRLRIEPDLASRSAASRTSEGIEGLARHLEDSRHEDPDRAWQGHYDFHEGLVAPAASSWDLRLLHTLWTAAERYTLLVFDPIVVDDEERERRHARHQRLFNRADAGDASGLEAELITHLEANEQEIERRIDAIQLHVDPGAEGESTE